MKKSVIYFVVFALAIISGCNEKPKTEMEKVEAAPLTKEEKTQELLNEFKKNPDEPNIRNDLVKIGAPVIKPLYRMLQDKAYKVTKKSYFIEKSDKTSFIPELWVPPTLMWQVRYGAVEVLDRIGGVDVLEPLIYAINDHHILVAERAAEALGKRKEKRAVEPLVEAIKIHCFPGLVDALGNIGNERAAEPLREQLANKEHLKHFMENEIIEIFFLDTDLAIKHNPKIRKIEWKDESLMIWFENSNEPFGINRFEPGTEVRDRLQNLTLRLLEVKDRVKGRQESYDSHIREALAKIEQASSDK